jgi:hypothetical protein
MMIVGESQKEKKPPHGGAALNGSQSARAETSHPHCAAGKRPRRLRQVEESTLSGGERTAYKKIEVL